jgi:hypothetical protein
MERVVGRTRQSKSRKMKKSVRALEIGTPKMEKEKKEKRRMIDTRVRWRSEEMRGGRRYGRSRKMRNGNKCSSLEQESRVENEKNKTRKSSGPEKGCKHINHPRKMIVCVL